jgi:hypothetical protein
METGRRASRKRSNSTLYGYPKIPKKAQEGHRRRYKILLRRRIWRKDSKTAENSILDYMGIPTKINTGEVNDKLSINALPVRGYVKIWNEWFRDQNLDDPVPENTGDDPVDNNAHTGTGWTQTKLNELAMIGDECLPVNKFHDYFTSCLPAPQKGPEVTIPMTGNAPIYWADRDDNPLTIQDLKNNGLWTDTGYLSRTLNKMMTQDYDKTTEKARAVLGSVGSGTKLGEQMTADLSSVTAATINELRQAFAVQHYYEALARGGSRYREIIRSVFGTLISDKTVQIPEYLGGGRYMINVSQVIQTSESGKTPQGNPGAVSVTPFNENSFTKSFEEHGFVIGVCCVRHDRTYQQGLERFWSRKDTLDFYYPQFANIGEQAVKVKEVYCASCLKSPLRYFGIGRSHGSASFCLLHRSLRRSVLRFRRLLHCGLLRCSSFGCFRSCL